MKKIIAVFGPGDIPSEGALFAQAESLGRQLAAAGFTILTGGYGGVMEAASKGAHGAGGAAIGITAEVFFARGREVNPFVTKEIRVKSANDRLMELLDLADAWCAIGNSTGTLAEVAMAWNMMVKNFIEKKPLLLLGEGWRKFISYLESENEFGPWLGLIEYCGTAEEAIDRLIAIFGAQPRLPDLQVIL